MVQRRPLHLYDQDHQIPRHHTDAPITSLKLLTDILRLAVKRSSNSGGLVSDGIRISFEELDLLSDRLAQALIRVGTESGDRVVAVLSNPLLFVVTCFAVWKARAIIVPEDPAIRPTNLLHILQETSPSTLIVDRDLVTQLEEAVAGVCSLNAVFVEDSPSGLSDIAGTKIDSLGKILASDPGVEIGLPRDAQPQEAVSITFTSGSTGIPKGVEHSHASWLAGVTFTYDYLQLTAEDEIIIPLPLHHAYAFRHVLAHLLAGATIVITDNIYTALKLLRERQPTALLLVPAACNIILDYFSSLFSEAGAKLRYIEIGTAAMSPARFHQLRQLLPVTEIHLPYGLTEARVGYLKPGEDGMLNRIVHMVPGLRVRVVNDVGEPVAVGQTGEIVVRGSGLMRGYWRSSEAEQVRLREYGFRTGDIGRIDDQGQVELLGRMDDVLKVGGRKVIPLQVEMALNRHPAVMESAVVGVPDPRGLFEQQLNAIVVVKDGHTVTASELIAHCRRYLETYKVPACVHFRSSLPKSPVGKVQRHVLMSEFSQGKQGGMSC